MEIGELAGTSGKADVVSSCGSREVQFVQHGDPGCFSHWLKVQRILLEAESWMHGVEAIQLRRLELLCCQEGRPWH
jgi:hypothetical protein